MRGSEFDIIEQFFTGSAAAFSSAQVRTGIGDDGAQLRVAAGRLLTVSMDVLVADVHFPADAPANLIAQRALAVNLSDLAAMGAEPLAFTLGLTLPEPDADWLETFVDGLAVKAREFDCPLVGGDLTRGPLTIAIQVHGSNGESGGILRTGAQAGDLVYVSGTLGDGILALANLGLETHLGAALEFDAAGLNEADRAYLHAAYYQPQPRLALGQACAGLVSAGIDISDGLLGDLGHITRASGVAARLDLSLLPVSSAASKSLSTAGLQRAAMLGGDDYELCLTVAPDAAPELEQRAARLQVPLTRIGEIEAGAGVHCVDSSGQPVHFPVSSYQHFASQS